MAPSVTGTLRDQLQSSLGTAYTLERELGGGGMSRVFVAMETRYGRRVVVKVLSPELTSGLSTSRFEREIGLAASLQQANIVPVLTSGDVDGLPFYTMPFVEGRSLRARLVDGQVPIAEVMTILRDLARALAYAHERHVVHRDIKPDNVLLSGGTAVVTDFGIAKAISAAITGADGSQHGTLTQLGTTLGTPAYMAPEQAAGDPSADHRSDLYAFGCVAYELLAGQPPFRGLTPQRLLAAHMGEKPRPVQELRADAPPGLALLVMQCLEKEPSLRPQGAEDIVRALDHITSGSALTMPSIAAGQVNIWKAVGIWAAVFGATWILARAAIVGVGLPDWVLPGALIVAGLGLPAVLATYWVQRATRRALLTTPTITPGGTHVPASTLQTMALRVSPHVSWARTWRGGVMAAVAFVAVVAAFMGLRAFGIGPSGSLFGKGVLSRNDPVVLARVSTTGTDTSLASVLTEALRSDLVQSRVISLLPPSSIRAALTRMQRPIETPLTVDVAREVAGREGAKLVVAADVASIGSGFVINARLVDPATGDPLASTRATADGPDELLRAVGQVTRALRERIGESLRSIQNSPRLERVTTSSFEAFRKYTEAIELSEGVHLDLDRARALLTEAVALDTTFAMAWRKLGWLVFDPHSSLEAFTKAFNHRDGLSDLERLQVEGSYYWLVVGDLDRGIDAHLRAAQIDSTVPRLMGNLAMLYYDKHDYQQSLAWARRTERVDSTQTGAYSLSALAALRNYGEADSVFRRMSLIVRDSSTRLGWKLGLLWGQERWDSLPRTLEQMIRTSSGMTRGQAVYIESVLTLLRGRITEGKAALSVAFEGGRSQGMPLPRVMEEAVKASFDAFVLEDAGVAARLDSAVQAARFDQIPPANQVFHLLAFTYAVARRPDRARAMLSRYDAEITDTLQRRREAAVHHQALGWIALVEERRDDAIAQFRASSVQRCYLCSLGALAVAFELNGQRDSAIHYFTVADELGSDTRDPSSEALWRPLVMRRLGELHEENGDIAKAIPYYSRFVDVWRNADPALQPKVNTVRAKLRSFAQTERR